MIVAAFIGGVFVGTCVGIVIVGVLSAGARRDLMDEIVQLNTEDGYPGKPYTHPRVAP